MDHYLGGLRGKLAVEIASIGAPGKDDKGHGITFVLGNESCDLDSAVCAIVYAYFLSCREILQENIIVPLLNVASQDLALKTEVVKCMLACGGLRAENVPCLEEIDFQALKKKGVDFKLVLVDHHNLFDDSLEDHLAEVIDHRPISSQLPASCRLEGEGSVKVTIKPVGSCATLVMKRIWEINPDFRDPEALKLIRLAIIADTANFSEEAKKTTPADMEVVNRIDLVLGMDVLSRRVDYQMVMLAKREIKGLSVTQCLRRDLKVIRLDGIGLAMSSLMASALKLVERENFFDDATTFLESNDCASLVVMGLYDRITAAATCDNSAASMERDMALFPTTAPSTVALTKHLPQSAAGALQLEPLDCATPGVKVFKQGDVAFSRKKVLPFIKDILTAAEQL